MNLLFAAGKDVFFNSLNLERQGFIERPLEFKNFFSHLKFVFLRNNTETGQEIVTSTTRKTPTTATTKTTTSAASAATLTITGLEEPQQKFSLPNIFLDFVGVHPKQNTNESGENSAVEENITSTTSNLTEKNFSKTNEQMESSLAILFELLRDSDENSTTEESSKEFDEKASTQSTAVTKDPEEAKESQSIWSDLFTLIKQSQNSSKSVGSGNSSFFTIAVTPTTAQTTLRTSNQTEPLDPSARQTTQKPTSKTMSFTKTITPVTMITTTSTTATSETKVSSPKTAIETTTIPTTTTTSTTPAASTTFHSTQTTSTTITSSTTASTTTASPTTASITTLPVQASHTSRTIKHESTTTSTESTVTRTDGRKAMGDTGRKTKPSESTNYSWTNLVSFIGR